MYSQSWAIKLCYKPYTKGRNKDSYPKKQKTKSSMYCAVYVAKSEANKILEVFCPVPIILFIYYV